MLNENLITELVDREIVTDTFRRLPSEKKERVYRVTIELFSDYGYDGLSIDEICKYAGVSKGSFFQYFPSKSHLLEFDIIMFDDYLSRWMEEIKKNETASLARERILHFYRNLVVNTKLFKAEQQFYLFVTNSLHHARVTYEGLDLERHFHNYISEIIRRGVDTGEIRGDVEVELTAHLVSLIISALLTHQYTPQKVFYRKTEEYLITFLFDGIKV